MSRIRKSAGFTLVELMVVIAIIIILMAILFPVFHSVREKARQTQCQSNLHQIAVAMKGYRADHGYYPPPPFYDTTNKMYQGGVSALYPDYITDKGIMICPDDRHIDGVQEAAKARLYSSYNGLVTAPSASNEASWEFATGTFHSSDNPSITITGPERTYNYYGYTQEGWDAYDSTNWPAQSALPTWLVKEHLGQWRFYPRLMNRDAPDNTFILHCINHRAFYTKANDEVDITVNLAGKTQVVNVNQMAQETNGASKWVSQND